MPEEEFTSRDLMTAMLSLHEATDLNIGSLRREMHARIDGVETRIDGVETRLTSLEGEVRGIAGEVRGIAGEVLGIKDWTRQVDQRFEAIAQAARIIGI
jgi:archaellum component FlaC